MKLIARAERWPIAGVFAISRGSVTEVELVVVELCAGGHVGRGECRPYPRYGENAATVLAEIESVRGAIEAGADRQGLQALLPPGAARNAIDCAFWDLEAKRAGVRAWTLARVASLADLEPVETCFTISLATPAIMAAAAATAAAEGMPILKLKIGGRDDLGCVEAVRLAAPMAKLVVDANEALTFDDLARLAPEFGRLGVTMIEQPLQAEEDEQLEGFDSPVPLCADESFHSLDDVSRCARRYNCINIKLDKTGGLTEALAAKHRAWGTRLNVMAGCMVATSLSMAPAMLIAQGAAVVDLDGPLLLAKDREPGLRYQGSTIYPPDAALWG